ILAKKRKKSKELYLYLSVFFHLLKKHNSIGIVNVTDKIA
ncbi:unnamed protein product, partial [marine sediment metagenome]